MNPAVDWTRKARTTSSASSRRSQRRAFPSSSSSINPAANCSRCSTRSFFSHLVARRCMLVRLVRRLGTFLASGAFSSFFPFLPLLPYLLSLLPRHPALSSFAIDSLASVTVPSCLRTPTPPSFSSPPFVVVSSCSACLLARFCPPANLNLPSIGRPRWRLEDRLALSLALQSGSATHARPRRRHLSSRHRRRL
jgi:hypothetical protein